jgi:hypothetical protein
MKKHLTLRSPDYLISVVDERVSWTASRAHQGDIIDVDDPMFGYLFEEVPGSDARGERPLESDELAERRRATRRG